MTSCWLDAGRAAEVESVGRSGIRRDSILADWCYHLPMRQLIARVDDDLHRRLKERARAEGRSLNALVTELLRAGEAGDETAARVRARLQADDLRVVPVVERRPPSRDVAIRATRGAGRAASEALRDERQAR
jgi:hypothetical protein